MKKIIFFDLDNTLHSTKNKLIPSQTVKLLEKLASDPNVILGLATGRGPSKIHMLNDFMKFFTYKIFMNGALAYKNNELIYKNPIKTEDILNVMEDASNLDVSIGFVALSGEYVTKHNPEVDYGMKGFNQLSPAIDEKAYLKEPIYQLWLFSKDNDKISKIAEKTSLLCYKWHFGGADLVDQKTNKAIAIKKVIENETDYKLITVGDGFNDIEMIKLADIGIAMDNSGFSELKEKADYIAPNIDANQLYDFFKEIKLVD